MSGVAHQTHEMAWGEECLAADAFAPPFDDDGCLVAAADAGSDGPIEADPPSPPLAASNDPATDAEPIGEAEAIEGAVSIADVEPVEDAGPVDEDESDDALHIEPVRADHRPDEVTPEPPDDAEASTPVRSDMPRLPRVAENEFLPGGACALPAIRVVPPPLALDLDARPVPDAASPPRPPALDPTTRPVSDSASLPPPLALDPDARPVPDPASVPLQPRRRRRHRLAAWTCACIAIVGAEIGAGLWNKQLPEILVRDVAAASGIHPDDFVRIAEIESRLDPKAFNRLSKAAGLFQLLPGTARQYKVADSFDARANAEAAARLFKHNAGRLRKALGREPTAWELYLAHQQGATGAIKLLKNPDKKAIEVVGRLPVLWNRGTEEMTARQFAAMWREAFNNKGKPAAVN